MDLTRIEITDFFLPLGIEKRTDIEGVLKPITFKKDKGPYSDSLRASKVKMSLIKEKQKRINIVSFNPSLFSLK